MDLPLSRAELDRTATARHDDTLAAALADDATRVVLVRDGLVAVDGQRLALAAPSDIAWMAVPLAEWLYLGRSADGTEWLAYDVPPDHTGEVTEFSVTRTWASLRDVGADLPAIESGAATTAVALALWHSRNQFCPRCGAATEPIAAGWIRRCTADGSEHYPRTDSAIIAVVQDPEGRLLLGHAAQWPAKRFSLIAGFVEPGESFEAATRREVAEETGVHVGSVTYVGSQPWPFPASIMVGVHAEALSSEIGVDGVEMTDARWFARADLARDVAAGEVLLPMRASIARALIEDWYGEPLPDSPTSRVWSS